MTAVSVRQIMDKRWGLKKVATLGAPQVVQWQGLNQSPAPSYKAVVSPFDVAMPPIDNKHIITNTLAQILFVRKHEVHRIFGAKAVRQDVRPLTQKGVVLLVANENAKQFQL